MNETLGALLVALPPVLGYALILRRLARRGGAVSAWQFGAPELGITLGLGTFLGIVAWSSLVAPAPAHQLQGKDLEANAIVELAIVGGMAGYLAARGFSLVEVLGLRRQPPLQAVGYAAGLIVLAFPLVATITKLVAGHLPKEVGGEQEIVSLFRHGAQHHAWGAIVEIGATAALLAPVVEEFMFRGYFYPALKRHLGPIASAVLTSLLFALVHANVATFAGLLVLALCLTIAYEWTGSILVPMGMHALFNAANLVLLYFFAPS